MTSEAKKEKDILEITATIYLTQWHGRAQDFVAVTGCFALFLLLPVRHYAKRAGTGYASATNTDAALTTKHLPKKGESWLPTSLQVPARNANPPSQRSKGRSWIGWNSCRQRTDTASASCSKIELSSASMLSRTSQFSLSYPTGKPTITNRLNAGELFTASNNFSNIKPEPAERRVFASGLAYGGNGGDDLGGDGVPPWIANPYQLISWWEMEQFSAHEFFSIGQLLSSIRECFRGSENADKEVTPGSPIHKWITRDWLPELDSKCRKIGLRVSAELIVSLNEYMLKGIHTACSKLASEFEHIGSTIRIEMSQVTFMHISAEQAQFYNQKELFGKDVNSKFPAIQYDITEAGNCYAAGRSTACIFHLMRIMEVGVQEFGAKLEVKLVNEKNWQNILDEVNKAIKALPKSAETIEMSQASANLYAVKLAWRNEVMHPKDTYTLEESDNLIRQVRLFMQQLAKIV